MERRFYLGLGILAVFLALALLVSWGLDRIQQPISRDFSQAASEALDGDLQAGISLARQAQQRWQTFRKRVAAVADHTPMDQIEELLAEAEVFAQAEDAEHFAACCAQLSRLTQFISDAHDPGWENIL